MKPTFALDLTNDSIGLLHRAPKGWLSIGEVAFDAPDLTEALAYLRKTALGLSPIGIATKIVIPNAQVLYTEIHAPGPSREDKRKQILAGLEGRTPYAVEDLVFDWSGKGATVKVAVVPKETLAEAEGFATEHRFNPVSFVATPDPGLFTGEPWFGQTDSATDLLAPGEVVDRDRDAIVLIRRELPKSEPVPPPAEAAPVAALTPVPDDDNEDPLPGLAEALTAQIPPTPPSEDAAPEAALDIGLPDDADAAPAAFVMPEPGPSPAADRWPAPDTLPLAALNGADPAQAKTSADRFGRDDADEAPFAHVTDPVAFHDGRDDPVPAASADPDDLPPAPAAAAMIAFASRRGAPAGVDPAKRSFGKPVEDLPPMPRPANLPPVKSVSPVPLRNGSAGASGFSGLVTAPTIPGTRKGKTKGLPSMPGLSAADPSRSNVSGKPLTKPGGTFGTRNQARGKPRFLGMILTALLLVFLALVAAWSSFYMASNGTQTDTSTAIVETADTGTSDTGTADAGTAEPGIDDEMLADMQDPEGMTDPLPEAAAAELAAPDLAAPEPAPALVAAETTPEPAPEPVPEPAPGTAVTTDLAAAQPLTEDQDEIFLAAMDSPPPALDALALPPPEATVDLLPGPQMPPPPFGTVYQFGADGLLKPTAGGIVSPEGVMLIAGKPPILPPSRSEIATAAALAASAIPAPDPAAVALPTAEPSAGAEIATPPADPAMQGFRPKPRPDGLAPASADDAALPPPGDANFASLRPLPRPATVIAAAASASPATSPATPPTDLGAQGASLAAQAEATLAAAAAVEAANPSIVAISRRPAARPRDLSRAVEAAVAAAVREPEPEVIASAEPAPDLKPEELDEVNEPDLVSVAPKIPTKANVAKQATFVNAINLSKTNLIGVYGTPSKRYALIRQSNGRYKKVKVGDRIDGGTIQAITETEVRYQKGGKLVSLKMPKA